MKMLQKKVDILYRFQCDKCRSRFEMTEKEKTENDWKYNESHSEDWVSNPMDYFFCPICLQKRHVRRGDMHRFVLFDDGTELQEY